MLGRMSGQAVHGDSVPEEVSAAIRRALEAAAKGGEAHDATWDVNAVY